MFVCLLVHHFGFKINTNKLLDLYVFFFVTQNIFFSNVHAGAATNSCQIEASLLYYTVLVKCRQCQLLQNKDNAKVFPAKRNSVNSLFARVMLNCYSLAQIQINQSYYFQSCSAFENLLILIGHRSHVYPCDEIRIPLSFSLLIMAFISHCLNTVNYEDSLSFLPIIVSQRPIHVGTGLQIRSTLI